jgi:N-acetylmuramoyl-L-alanine amidase
MKTRWLAPSLLAACLGAAAGTSVADDHANDAADDAADEAADHATRDPARDTARDAALPRTPPAGVRGASPLPGAPDLAGSPGERAPLRVVLDPGHGGTNTGARGAVEGVVEKRVTLAIAQRLAEELRAAGLEVSLTRQIDRTLTLRQRSELANRAGADLFVSVHANASPSRSQRGFETYVLTPGGVDVIAPALRSDAPGARPTAAGRRAVSAEVAAVLDDIERGAAQWEAAELATAVQSSLRALRGRERDRGVRQDAHHVLLGATMPAILVEVGFVDHPIEGRELAQPETQQALAASIATAIVEQAQAHR